MKQAVAYLAVLFIVLSFQAMAQRTFTVRGKVTSFEEKPLPNISIYVATGKVARTDSLGNFIINDVWDGDTLSFYGIQIGPPYKEVIRGNNFIHARIPITRPEAHGVTFESPISVPIKGVKLKKTKAPEVRKGVFVCVFDSYATPRSGWKTLNDQVLANLKYPEEALKHNIEGVVVAGFRITSQGKLENLKIVKGLGYGCDDEVLRTLSIGIKWIPSISDGHPVDQEFEYPVTFKLKKE